MIFNGNWMLYSIYLQINLFFKPSIKLVVPSVESKVVEKLVVVLKFIRNLGVWIFATDLVKSRYTRILGLSIYKCSLMGRFLTCMIRIR